jgi:glutamate racemase
MKIGVFDSGIGGLTVLAALRERLPHAEYVYLGDTANLPYGTKSPAQVTRLSVACAERLKPYGLDALVVACNTASSVALEAIREAMGTVPVFGVVEPGVQAVVEALEAWPASEYVPILVLATRATIKSASYGKSLRSFLEPATRPVFEQACPILVPMIEEGWINHQVLHDTISEYVGPVRAVYLTGVVLLGCTHYPWIEAAIQAQLPGWKVVNSAFALGRLVSAQLNADKARGTAPGSVEWIFTDPDALPAFACQFINGQRRSAHVE